MDYHHLLYCLSHFNCKISRKHLLISITKFRQSDSLSVFRVHSHSFVPFLFFVFKASSVLASLCSRYLNKLYSMFLVLKYLAHVLVYVCYGFPCSINPNGICHFLQIKSLSFSFAWLPPKGANLCGLP